MIKVKYVIVKYLFIYPQLTINHSLIFDNFPFTAEAHVSTEAAAGLLLVGFWFQCGMGDSDWLSVQVVKFP